MKTFFSAIQGKFKADYHGRYMGHILEQIAQVRPEMMKPIIKKAPLYKGRPSRNVDQIVSTETRYLIDEITQAANDKKTPPPERVARINSEELKNRQADIEITLTGNEYSARIVVEIKIDDKFHSGQLDDYIKWASLRTATEDRAVVVLTAYPLEPQTLSDIEKNSKYISHMYLSELIDDISASKNDSELISIFKNYLIEKSYAMYQLQKNNDDLDYKALHSYMVLSFLPHASGHGRVSKSENIARGPVVFSNLVQNWQLISNRLAAELNLPRNPTVRYYPQQVTRELIIDSNLSEANILKFRKKARDNKEWGRYWLCADCVIPKTGLRLEWGQILQIKNGNEANEEETIECIIYAFIRRKGEQLSGNTKELRNGIRNSALYSPEKFMGLIRQCIDVASKSATSKFPEIKDSLKQLEQH
ncbi:MAG: PD-(D/E)XK nuclease family protein [Burkholderiales bacterium]|nr:PD-(D/E)XK nuclease family protein [Burkholderiales bacterium]